jgi:hypothetical protein
VNRQAELLEVVRALNAPGGLAGRLDGGEQQGDQDSDDRDDNKEFNQRKTTPAARICHVRNLGGRINSALANRKKAALQARQPSTGGVRRATSPSIRINF